jgi:iron complex transport system ATP-binding protein
MDKLDFPGVVLPRTPEVLALYSQQLLTVLSSAVIGGGMVRVRYLLNRHVRHDYNCLAPGADLVAFARSQSISEAFVGQKAGVSLQKARTSIGKSNGLFHPMVRTKSGGNRAVSPEFIIRGVIFHPSRVKS